LFCVPFFNLIGSNPLLALGLLNYQTNIHLQSTTYPENILDLFVKQYRTHNSHCSSYVLNIKTAHLVSETVSAVENVPVVSLHVHCCYKCSSHKHYTYEYFLHFLSKWKTPFRLSSLTLLLVPELVLPSGLYYNILHTVENVIFMGQSQRYLKVHLITAS
jgi:hypothetical protein